MKILGMIMAGGKGERLYPLTKDRSKPSVPFGGKYRIVDFVLSNFVNSGIFSSYVLVQYLSQSLIEYLRTTWRSEGIMSDHFLTCVPPQMRLGEIWYRGTADSVRQNINLVKDFAPDLVAIFGADHIYRMDVRQMVDFHLKNKADVTVAANTVSIEQATAFGVLGTDETGRIVQFDEKPANPKPIPGNPKAAYASMGNYIFNTDVLLKVLQKRFCDVPALDFGKHILPKILMDYRTFAYDFQSQTLPGAKSYEEQGYWRDVGTIESFWQTNMDLLGPKPKLDLNNPAWPINTTLNRVPASKFLGGTVTNSIVGDGCVIHPKAKIKNCVISDSVTVGEGAEMEGCVIMDNCEIKAGAKLKKVIMDRFNTIAAKQTIGINQEADSQKYYIDPSGIVVIPRGKNKF
ncbi:MAG: glucose-1-phosphate adenylyltransferase [Elusimicrobia bacterium]|nr:glucose-1-phosphate adenylyltransferase [Elusimicrobiota bacterium]MDD7578827.1 glucose-1-phosphate adenylyltransferase [Elusimicrobiota bacterium]MDY6039523.1 glucose-1-phosphate adenylyltransferase [Elusimicrobiaceae bacterium]